MPNTKIVKIGRNAKNGQFIPIKEADIKLGYVPYDVAPACQTLDYAFNDYCVAQMAKALGKKNDYKFYLKRYENWRNLFHPEFLLRFRSLSWPGGW